MTCFPCFALSTFFILEQMALRAIFLCSKIFVFLSVNAQNWGEGCVLFIKRDILILLKQPWILQKTLLNLKTKTYLLCPLKSKVAALGLLSVSHGVKREPLGEFQNVGWTLFYRFSLGQHGSTPTAAASLICSIRR